MTLNGAAGAAVPEIEACAADVFATLALPPPDPVLAPVLARGCITLLTGVRGVGKSWIALAMAHAAASGSALAHWRAPAPVRAVFIDAAMSRGLLQARLRLVAGNTPSPNLAIASGDAQARGLPDLGTDVGLTALDRLVADAELVVLDGLAALVRPGHGVGRRWAALADWLRSLRRRGTAVLLVEPAEPRALAALADTLVRLSRPADWLPDQGLRAVVSSKAARGLTGFACRRCELRLSTASGAAVWTRIDALDQEAILAWKLHHAGLSMREIGRRLGSSAATACRAVQRARALDPALRDGPELAESAEAEAATVTGAETVKQAAGEGTAPAAKSPETVQQPPAADLRETLKQPPAAAPPETLKQLPPEAQTAPVAEPGETVKQPPEEDSAPAPEPPETAAPPPQTLDEVETDELLQVYLARRRAWQAGLVPPPDRLGGFAPEALACALRTRLTTRVLNRKILEADGRSARPLSEAERLWRTPHALLPCIRGIA